jgi:hypothetical protein
MPRRLLPLVLGAALLAAAGTPARAQPATGSVQLPAPSSAAARALYMYDAATNGTLGYAFRLHGNPVAAPYTLRRTGGATGFENLDVYFYSDVADGSGFCVPKVTRNDYDAETGVVCGDSPGWAIVIIGLGSMGGASAGANAAFTFTY